MLSREPSPSNRKKVAAPPSPAGYRQPDHGGVSPPGRCRHIRRCSSVGSRQAPQGDRTIRRLTIAVTIAVLAITGCSSVSERASELRERVSDIEFDLDATLDQVRDCDRISDVFVSAVRTAAVSVDGLAERTGEQIPATDIEALVEKVSVSDYYDLGAKLGCARLNMELTTVERLRELQTETQTPAGDEFLEELLDQLEQSQ